MEWQWPTRRSKRRRWRSRVAAGRPWNAVARVASRGQCWCWRQKPPLQRHTRSLEVPALLQLLLWLVVLDLRKAMTPLPQKKKRHWKETKLPPLLWTLGIQALDTWSLLHVDRHTRGGTLGNTHSSDFLETKTQQNWDQALRSEKEWHPLGE